MKKVITPKQSRYKIEQVRLDDMAGAKMWNLEEFAGEFGHKILPIFPIFIVLVDGELLGYYYAQPQVCIYPAAHPDKANPRMFYEVVKIVVAAAKQVFGNPLWIIDKRALLGNAPDFLEKVALRKADVNVYETLE